MPIYEWQCERDGRVFEVLAPANAANRRRRCPSCGGNFAPRDFDVRDS